MNEETSLKEFGTIAFSTFYMKKMIRPHPQDPSCLDFTPWIAYFDKKHHGYLKILIENVIKETNSMYSIMNRETILNIIYMFQQKALNEQNYSMKKLRPDSTSIWDGDRPIIQL